MPSVPSVLLRHKYPAGWGEIPTDKRGRAELIRGLRDPYEHRHLVGQKDITSTNNVEVGWREILSGYSGLG